MYDYSCWNKNWRNCASVKTNRHEIIEQTLCISLLIFSQIFPHPTIAKERLARMSNHIDAKKGLHDFCWSTVGFFCTRLKCLLDQLVRPWIGHCFSSTMELAVHTTLLQLHRRLSLIWFTLNLGTTTLLQNGTLQEWLAPQFMVTVLCLASQLQVVLANAFSISSFNLQIHYS